MAVRFLEGNGRASLEKHVRDNRGNLLRSCDMVVDPSLTSRLEEWLSELPGEVEEAARKARANSDLLQALTEGGLLPKYAFPVDVVSLSVPDDEEEEAHTNPRTFIPVSPVTCGSPSRSTLREQRIVKGRFPKTYIYKSAGLYDPSNQNPDYDPSEQLVECRRCRAVTLLFAGGLTPSTCSVCGLFDLMTIPYVRPPGFTVDAALPDAGRREYRPGGRERAGFGSSAQLLVGATPWPREKPTTTSPRASAPRYMGATSLCATWARTRSGQGFCFVPPAADWLTRTTRCRILIQRTFLRIAAFDLAHGQEPLAPPQPWSGPHRVWRVQIPPHHVPSGTQLSHNPTARPGPLSSCRSLSRLPPLATSLLHLHGFSADDAPSGWVNSISAISLIFPSALSVPAGAGGTTGDVGSLLGRELGGAGRLRILCYATTLPGLCTEKCLVHLKIQV